LLRVIGAEMPITDFDHYTVRTADHEASRRFYGAALGLNIAEREGWQSSASKPSAPPTQSERSQTSTRYRPATRTGSR
jgi:catechol 2,3-dioxygenase-like lactoylglutathione lyase family enzyme